MFAVSIPNLAHFLGIGRDGDEMPGDRGGGRRSEPARIAQTMEHHARAVWALVIVSSVVNVFDETMNSVSAGSRSRVASAKSVPSTLETNRNVKRAVAVMPECLVGHHRAQVRAADADVDRRS